MQKLSLKYSFLVILVLLMLTPKISLSQENETALIQKMNHAQGKEKVDLLNQLSVDSRKSDRYAALKYASNAYQEAKTINYTAGCALAKKNQGIIWFFMESYDSAISAYKEALACYKQINDAKGESAIYNNLGLIFQERSNYDMAVEWYERSIEIDKTLHEEAGISSTKGNIAAIYIYQGYYLKALALLNEIVAIETKLSRKPELANALINRAAVYDNLKRFPEALTDLSKAESIAISENDSFQQVQIYSNLGLVYFHLKKPEEALKWLNKALTINDDTNESSEIISALWVMADIYTSQEKYAESNEILQRVLKLGEEAGNKVREARALTSLGRNLMEMNEIDKAIGYFTKSLEITKAYHLRSESLENYRNLAQAEAVMHNFSISDSLTEQYAILYNELYTPKSDETDLSAERSKQMPTIASPADWIIAFSLIILICLLSVKGFVHKSNTEQ